MAFWSCENRMDWHFILNIRPLIFACRSSFNSSLYWRVMSRVCRSTTTSAYPSGWDILGKQHKQSPIAQQWCHPKKTPASSSSESLAFSEGSSIWWREKPTRMVPSKFCPSCTTGAEWHSSSATKTGHSLDHQWRTCSSKQPHLQLRGNWSWVVESGNKKDNPGFTDETCWGAIHSRDFKKSNMKTGRCPYVFHAWTWPNLVHSGFRQNPSIILFLQPFFSIFRQRQQPFQRHIQICCFDWNAASTSGPVAEL